MNLLQFSFIISGIIILVLAIDISRKQKFNALHFIIFLSIWVGLLIFTIFPGILNYIWNFFWVARWADVLVYWSIIFLLYFALLLLSKHLENKDSITDIIRELAISNSRIEKLNEKYVFVIPAYNEWKYAYNTIKNILANGFSNIIVINDGSNDDTKLYLEKFNNDIILLTHFKNRWQWASLETWFEYIRRYCQNKYVVTFDADGQHDLNDLKEFEKHLDNDVEIFLWSRFLWKTTNNIPFLRKIILKLWIIFTFFISNMNLSDTHNWYRVIKRETLKKIKITIDWMWHASEIIDIISQKNISYKEIPVNIKYTNRSLTKWQSSLNAINIALKIIWNKFFK
jgi:hypothetical protein